LQLLFNRNAIALVLLRNHFLTLARSLRNHCEVAPKSLYNRNTIALQSPYNHIAIAVKSLQNPGEIAREIACEIAYHCAVTANREDKWRSNRFLIVMQSRYNHIAIAVESLHKPCEIAAESLRNHIAIAVDSLHNRCAIACRIATKKRCDFLVIAIQSL
jgi:hypothetical protein